MVRGSGGRCRESELVVTVVQRRSLPPPEGVCSGGRRLSSKCNTPTVSSRRRTSEALGRFEPTGFRPGSTLVGRFGLPCVSDHCESPHRLRLCNWSPGYRDAPPLDDSAEHSLLDFRHQAAKNFLTITWAQKSGGVPLVLLHPVQARPEVSFFRHRRGPPLGLSTTPDRAQRPCLRGTRWRSHDRRPKVLNIFSLSDRRRRWRPLSWGVMHHGGREARRGAGLRHLRLR